MGGVLGAPNFFMLDFFGCLFWHLIIHIFVYFRHFSSHFLSGKEKHININKFAGLSRDWVGCQNFVYVFLSGHSLWDRNNTHKQTPPFKIPGQSREFFVYVFFSLCVFSVKVRRGRREGDGTENVMTERPSHARWFCP